MGIFLWWVRNLPTPPIYGLYIYLFFLYFFHFITLSPCLYIRTSTHAFFIYVTVRCEALCEIGEVRGAIPSQYSPTYVVLSPKQLLCKTVTKGKKYFDGLSVQEIGVTHKWSVYDHQIRASIAAPPTSPPVAARWRQQGAKSAACNCILFQLALADVAYF